MNLLLKNLRWFDGRDYIEGDVRIKNELIIETGRDLPVRNREHVFSFPGHYLYPGLVNAHDHLEMNLYPQLGSPPYENYLQWAKAVYKPEESPVRDIQKIKIDDRLLWGGIKNLIAGATTVVHHNPWHQTLGSHNFPVKVLKNFAWSHSHGLGKSIQKDFPSHNKIPYIIHAAEGIDQLAKDEIQTLDHLHILKENTVIVHGVAIDEKEIELMTSRQSSLIWCPSSNLFMFNRTCPVDKIISKIRVTLGTDSTLTGSPTLLDELKSAARTSLVSARELFTMVIETASKIFRLPPSEIREGTIADLFIAPVQHHDYFENLILTDPAHLRMVVVNGNVRLAETDPGFLKYKIKINQQERFTDVNVPALIERISEVAGDDILQQNPLVKLLQ